MRSNSNISSSRVAEWPSGKVAKRRRRSSATRPPRHFATRGVWAICLLLVCAGLSGCESLERKFTRKPKGPRAAPTPVINFQDYTQAMTPLDRYRKHYLIFDYWNDDFMAALQAKSMNAKRLKLASSESLNELTALQGLVADDLVDAFAPLIEVRTKIDKQVQAGSVSESSANDIWRELDAQSRTIRRELFWRNVQDRLKPAQTPKAELPPAAEEPPAAPGR